jgi:hypothetical protein
LIANHIAKRTGKYRTPKQISSHLQVLHKRGAEDGSATLGSSAQVNF